MSEGFFSRWSRRKREAGHGDDQAPEAAPQLARHPDAPSAPDQRSAPVPAPGLAAGAGASTGAGAGQTPQGSPPPAEPLPTLDDVQQLTPESDFQPFMRQGVGSEVRNAAMKKLFADPHFNVMDGLDIYIDDYSLPDPMPAGMLHQMASAQFMKLVPEEGSERHPQDPDGVVAGVQGAQVVAQSPDSSATAEPPQHDHPDLQLQQDPAAGPPAPGPGPR